MLRLGAQAVYFGTSEDMADVPDGTVDLVVTSPPYWNLKDYGCSDVEIGREPYETYLKRLDCVWAECYRACREDAVMVVDVRTRRHRKRFYPLPFDIAARMQRWQLWDSLIWYIPNALPQCNHYRNRLFDDKTEYLLVFAKGDPERHTFHKPRVPQKYADADPRDNKNEAGRCLGNVIRIPAYRPPNVKQMGYHVAAFPEELAALLIHTYTDPGGTVLDPFLGSGTTLKVAEHMGRRGIGYELNRDFAGLIEARIAEPWQMPDWRDLDVLHSATAIPGTLKPRKAQFRAESGRAPKRGTADT